MIGSKVAHYEITSLLGTGGMGEVYRATDSKLARSVALKFLPAAFAADGERLTRFRREAQVLASLNHPNIAHIYGLEESGKASCIVMELVEERRCRSGSSEGRSHWMRPWRSRHKSPMRLLPRMKRESLTGI